MRHSSLQQILAVLIVSAVGIPLVTTQAIFRSVDGEGRHLFEQPDLRPAAIEYQTGEWRTLRRDYSKAVEIYRDLVRKGVLNLVPPDINDIESIRSYLDKSVLEDSQHAAAGSGVSLEEISQLPTQERYRLMGFVDSGRCHPALQWSYLPGFYQLCIRLLEEGIAPGQVRGNYDVTRAFRSVRGHTAAPDDSLKTRLRIMNESLEKVEEYRDSSNQRFRFRRDEQLMINPDYE